MISQPPNAWLVDAVRRHKKELQDLESAVDRAIDEMPVEYVIKKFLTANREEVKSMFLTEYNQEKVLEKERKEAVGDERTRVATDMLKDGKPLEEISKYSKLTEKAVRALAKTIGVAVIS